MGTAANGTVVLNADNTVTYTPNSGTTASSDSFTYTISDGYGGTSAATVYVQLADRTPVAQAVNVSTHSAAVTIAVLTSGTNGPDGDPDGDPMTVTVLGSCTYGTATINADGTVTYHANSGTSGHTDYFTYTISDGHGGTSTSTIAIVIA